MMPPSRPRWRRTRPPPIASTAAGIRAAGASAARRTLFRECRRPASPSRRRELLFEQLLLVQLPVEAALLDQRLMGPTLDDATAVQHEDLIGVAHRRDAVRHDD